MGGGQPTITDLKERFVKKIDMLFKIAWCYSYAHLNFQFFGNKSHKLFTTGTTLADYYSF
jgi:hypothetical protein